MHWNISRSMWKRQNLRRASWIHPLLLKINITYTLVQNCGYKIEKREISLQKYCPRLFAVSLFSFRYETTKGHTPTILATTSTSYGMTSLLLMMAFFSAGREAIQSRLSPPSARWQWTPSSSRGPEFQRHLSQSVEIIVWEGASQSMDTKSAFADIDCPGSSRTPQRAHVHRPALTPQEQWDQARRWFVSAQPPPHSCCCWTDSELTRRHDEINCCPSTEWTPKCVRPTPQALCRNSLLSLPNWRPCSNCAGTCQ